MPKTVPTLSSLYFDRARDAQQRGTLCVMTLLAWISACDGLISPGEEELLTRVFDGEAEAADLGVVLQIARRADVDDLELACRHVQRKLGRGRRRLLLDLAVAVAFQDGKLTTPENHALQFMADLLGVRPRSFFKVYRSLTGQSFPVPHDLDSADWWQHRDAGDAVDGEWHIPEGDATKADVTTSAEPPPLSRCEALRILGLTDDATPDAVHSAYHRVAKRRHPDHFVNLGPAAVAVATELFQRVSQAHKLLAGS